ncbi:hypothetical protein C1646_664185, partial [Rhizophagus diaphanus]
MTPLEKTRDAWFNDLLKTYSPKKLGSPQKVREFYQLPKSLTDDEVVEMVNQWRLDSDKEEEDSDASDKEVANTSTNRQLKRDNVQPEEVVEIIKDMRVKKQEKRKEKVAYTPYKKSTNNSDQMKNLKEKLSELDEIFKETENEMDWEKMKADVVWDINVSYDLSSDKEFKEWSMKKNNFMLL